jgi:hypothetical protein
MHVEASSGAEAWHAKVDRFPSIQKTRGLRIKN